MWIIGTAASVVLIVLILLDGFETILQPRRVTHRFRFARLFYRNTWLLWRVVAMRIGSTKRREGFLSFFGPLSLLGLFGAWCLGLIFAFALLHWSLQSPMNMVGIGNGFGAYFYLSGSNFFTLGYGDITPAAGLGRFLAVSEAGLGFGFLAIMISYLPVLSQAFSSRERIISQMDARASSPPSAMEFLVRLANSGNIGAVDSSLIEWERWAAELLESHLSFPVLSYYRSQHDNQSWLAALTTMLDSCALILAQVKGVNTYQTQLTFAMARHAAVDLALVLKTPATAPQSDRLSDDRVEQIRQLLRELGLELNEASAANSRLRELRGMYEPFVNALASRFLLTLPPLMSTDATIDNWQRSAWMARAPGINRLAVTDDQHFG